MKEEEEEEENENKKEENDGLRLTVVLWHKRYSHFPHTDTVLCYSRFLKSMTHTHYSSP